MTVAQALAFVERHGIVLESARRGATPSLADAVAGEPIPGGWWSHRAGREIFAITRAVRESADVLVCRLVDGKITFVHRRLWPALACLAPELPPERIARIEEEHTKSGAHRTVAIPFPEWLPQGIEAEARRLGASAARKALSGLVPGLEGDA